MIDPKDVDGWWDDDWANPKPKPKVYLESTAKGVKAWGDSTPIEAINVATYKYMQSYPLDKFAHYGTAGAPYPIEFTGWKLSSLTGTVEGQLVSKIYCLNSIGSSSADYTCRYLYVNMVIDPLDLNVVYTQALDLLKAKLDLGIAPLDLIVQKEIHKVKAKFGDLLGKYKLEPVLFHKVSAPYYKIPLLIGWEGVYWPGQKYSG